MSYNSHCNTLLDTTKQVLLDGKALVDLILNPEGVSDLDEMVMNQVRKAIEDSELLSTVARSLDTEFSLLFQNSPPSVSEKFHFHAQIFLNSSHTVQNSMFTLTRLTKSTISNIYMQTDISISREKVDNCCKNLTTALKSLLSAMEVLRKLGDELMKTAKSNPSSPTQQPRSDDAPLDHGVVLEGASKTMREWIQKLVNVVIQGHGNTGEVAPMGKSFYDVGRATMNHMGKLINVAKKIGMPDEEARLKLLLFQLLSLAKSFNSTSELSGTLSDKQVQELNLVKVQIEESLWWFVKMAKLRLKQVSYQPDLSREDSPNRLSFPTSPFPAKPLPPIPAPKSANANSEDVLSLDDTNSTTTSAATLSRSPSESNVTPTRTSPRISLITPTSSAAKFEHSVSKLMAERNLPMPDSRFKPSNSPMATLTKSASLASLKSSDYLPNNDDTKARRKVVEIPHEVVQDFMSDKKRPVSQQFVLANAPGRAYASHRISAQNWSVKPSDFKLYEQKLAEATAAIKPDQVPPASPKGSDDKPPELPPKPQNLSLISTQDKEANMTLRSGVLRRAAHTQSVIFDTKKQHQASTMGVYLGEIDAQLMNFRAKVHAHVEYILLDTYSLKKDDLEMLIAEKDARVNTLWSTMQNPFPDKKKDHSVKNPALRKNPNLKIKPFDDLSQIFGKHELEASAELAKRLEGIIQVTFDQYEGLRQINDFRSMPEVGQMILQTSNITNTGLKKQLLAGAILIVYNFLQQVLTNKEIVKIYLPATKDEFLEVSRHEHNFKLATDNILLEYCKLKAGLLMKTGYVSSIVEQINGHNLNHVIVDKFLTEIYEITEACIQSQSDLFSRRAMEVEKLPKKRQKIIYSKFGGKEAFSHLATSTLTLLRPWMRKWVDVQVPAIVQREIFAKDVDDLKIALEDSKNTMVASFKELLNNQVPEPLFKFDAILKTIDEELELGAAIFAI